MSTPFLSDRLKRLSELFSDFEHEARVLEPDAAREMRRVLTGLRLQARQMEHEISRHRWNDTARRDREEGERIAGLIGGNVVAFPNLALAFSDGRDGPREWR